MSGNVAQVERMTKAPDRGSGAFVMVAGTGFEPATSGL